MNLIDLAYVSILGKFECAFFLDYIDCSDLSSSDYTSVHEKPACGYLSVTKCPQFPSCATPMVLIRRGKEFNCVVNLQQSMLPFDIPILRAWLHGKHRSETLLLYPNTWVEKENIEFSYSSCMEGVNKTIT